MNTRKILVSPDFGAGWSTWMDGEVREFALTYQPIIDWLEAGNRFSRQEYDPKFDPRKEYEGEAGELLWKFKQEAEEKFGTDVHLYFGGARGLCVYEVPEGAKFRIHEYDGSESVEIADEMDWITL